MRTHHSYRWLVHRILLEHRDARNSDKVLWHRVIKELTPEISKMPFEKALMVSNLPSYDSITRVRRWWQARDVDCMSDFQIAMGRAEKEQEYRREYGSGKGRLHKTV